MPFADENKSSCDLNTIESSYKSEKNNELYQIDGDRIRLCLIINQFHFLNCDREGSQYDVNRLLKLFEKSLKFETHLVCDATSDEITTKLGEVKELCLDERKEISMLVVIVMSHGIEESILTTDGKLYEIKKIIEEFRGEVMRGRPKFFIIQACRGSICQGGVIAEEKDEENLKNPFDWTKLPVDADILVAYSSVQGYACFRNEKYGSIFINLLYKIFMSNLKINLDVVSLLTLVNRLTAYKFATLNETKTDIYKQMPSFRSNFTKKLYLSSIKESTIATVGIQEEKRLLQIEKLYKLTEKEFVDCELSYSYKNKLGYCVIFSQGTPPEGMNMKARLGADKDRDEIRKLFQDTLKYGCKNVYLFENLPRVDIIFVLEQIANLKNDEILSLFVIMLTYGENGTENNKSLSFWANDGKISIDDLVSPLKGDKCPKLVNIPKVFLIQACEGDKQGPVVNSSLPQVKYPNKTTTDRVVKKTVPIEANILLTYSTVPAIDDEDGSLYVKHFCETIRNGYETMDLLSLLTIVNRKVTEEIMVKSECFLEHQKQMPCFVSQLTKKYYFTKRPTVRTEIPTDPLNFSATNKKSICIIFDQTQSPNKHCRKLNNDADVLKKIFVEKLKFEVTVCKNFTKQKVQDHLCKVKSDDGFDRAICLVVIMLSHFEDKKTIWANDESFDVSLLTNPFREQNCPQLRGKKKIFIIQGCLKNWINDTIEWNDLHDPALIKEDMHTVYSIKNGDCEDNGVYNSEFVKIFHNWTIGEKEFEVGIISKCVAVHEEKCKQNESRKTHVINGFKDGNSIECCNIHLT